MDLNLRTTPNPAIRANSRMSKRSGRCTKYIGIHDPMAAASHDSPAIVVCRFYVRKHSILIERRDGKTRALGALAEF